MRGLGKPGKALLQRLADAAAAGTPGVVLNPRTSAERDVIRRLVARKQIVVFDVPVSRVELVRRLEVVSVAALPGTKVGKVSTDVLGVLHDVWKTHRPGPAMLEWQYRFLAEGVPPQFLDKRFWRLAERSKTHDLASLLQETARRAGLKGLTPRLAERLAGLMAKAVSGAKAATAERRLR